MLYCSPNPHNCQLLPAPHPKSRGNSLKNSQTIIGPQHITKRHSLDTRHPSHPSHSHKPSSVLDNAQELLPVSKNNNSKGLGRKKGKGTCEDNARVKYYWRGKQGRQSKKGGLGKEIKGRGMWSQLGKDLNVREKGKYLSRGKQDFSKINISDRLQNKQQITHPKSFQQSYKSQKTKNQRPSPSRLKAKSLLNSTMLTKREEDELNKVGENRFGEMVLKIKQVLDLYQNKIKQLVEQKEHYRLKLRKARKRNWRLE